MEKKKEIFTNEETFMKAFTELAAESEQLKENMQIVMAKYKRALEILTKLQRKNSDLEHKLGMMKAREAALIGHIKSNLVDYMEKHTRETIDERMIH